MHSMYYLRNSIVVIIVALLVDAFIRPVLSSFSQKSSSKLKIVNTSVSKHRHYDVFESTYKNRPSFHFHRHELPSSRMDFYRYNVLFNKPMYLNLTIPLQSKDVEPFLQGIVRFRCGSKILESYLDRYDDINLVETGEDRTGTYLKPIFDQHSNGHMFSAILVMGKNRWKAIKGLQNVKPKDCTMKFLHKYERSNDNYNTLTSIDGEEVMKDTIVFNKNHHKIEERHLIPITINSGVAGNDYNGTGSNSGNNNTNAKNKPIDYRLKYTLDKSHFYNPIKIGSGDKHKESAMSLSPVKFMKLMHIYTRFVDLLLNDTKFVNIVLGKQNSSNGVEVTNMSHDKRRRHLLNKDIESDEHQALMKAVGTLRMKTLLKLGLHAGELYEVIIKPIATALGKQLPELLFELVKFPLSVLLRDETTSGMKAPLTEPLLNQLDPRSLFGAGSGDAPTASTGAHHGERHAAGVADDVGLQVTDNVLNSLSKALWHRIELQLPHAIATQSARHVSQGVISTVTYTLTHSISRALIEILSTSLTKAIARNVNAALIPSLTYSLVPVITHSLMHSPRADYYCFYCVKANIYCKLCSDSHAYDYKQDYYISYYTGYYTQYYAHAYSTGLSDGAAEEYFSKTGQVPRI